MSSHINKISLIIGTAGHIDHGKTSLVKALTAIDTDRLKEEKKRGLTIDLGFAYIDFEIKGRSYRAAIIDVPGHERFIKNMLTGATGMDLVLFTVAADDGIMPQTIEHFEIIRLLGIREVFFIITKCDLVDRARMDEVESSILSLIKGTPMQQRSSFFRVSVKTEEGLAGLKGALTKKILSMRGRTRGQGGQEGQEGQEGEKYFRMPVDRSFTIKGFGTVVTGTVASGTLNKGSSLVVYPSAEALKVRGMESMHIKAEKVSAGERAAINLSGVSRKDLRRGACLMAPELEPYIRMAPVIDCSFEFIGKTGKKGIRKKGVAAFRDRALIKVHHQTGEALARIRFLGRKSLLPGETARGRLFLRRPLLMMRGDPFILRDPSVNTTVGGGSVIFSYADKGLVPGFNRLAGFHGRDNVEKTGGGEGLADDLSMLTCLSRPGFELKTLSILLNVRLDSVEAFIRERINLKEGPFFLSGGFLITQKHAEEVMQAMQELLGRYHEKNPLETGLTEEDLVWLFISGLKERKNAESVRPVYRFIASLMASKGLVLQNDGRLCLKGFTPALSDSERKIAEAIKGLLESKGLGLTKKEEIMALNYPAHEIEGIITYMSKEGSVISLKKGYYIETIALNSARESIAKFIIDNGGVKASQCRDILGCGRKLAIEILEYLDSAGFTLRNGDLRTLR